MNLKMGKGLAHIVFFTLNDASSEMVSKLQADCQTYLSGHPGTNYFSVGTRNIELDRPVNDSEFHVALHVCFESKEAHDAYQVHPRHTEFIERQKSNWKSVRVFDSDLP